MAVEHYENFPVASVLLPKRLRKPVEVIYNFARQADDFADEGDLTDAERLANLDGFREELKRIESGTKPHTALFVELAQIIQQHHIPLSLFFDLLDAFSQDVVKKRYATFEELHDYCRRSANPVGRILLHLYQQATPENLAYSDAICTALQLINFWQDVNKDIAIGRIYIPQEDLLRFTVSELAITQRQPNENWRALMQFEINRARQMMLQGKPLGGILRGRIGMEMRLIIAGGLRILSKIEQVKYDVFNRRPELKKWDWVVIIKNVF
jgi:phytoene synthase